MKNPTTIQAGALTEFKRRGSTIPLSSVLGVYSKSIGYYKLIPHRIGKSRTEGVILPSIAVDVYAHGYYHAGWH
jgi:hypothetical protein